MAITTRTTEFGGKTVELRGPGLRPGDKAPDFKLQDIDSKDVTLSDSRGEVRLLSVAISLDTSVCDLQTQRFEQEAAKFKNVVIYAITMDLPFAQARYCGAHDISNLRTLSDHRDASFGEAYGVLMPGPRLLSRAIFIIDKDDTVRYVEYVPEAGRHPDYEKAIKELKKLAGD